MSAVMESKGNDGIFVSFLSSNSFPNFSFFHSPLNPGRRFLPVSSCCIKPFLRSSSFSTSCDCFSIASSHVLRTSAIFCCSDSGGSSIGNFATSLLVIFGSLRLLAAYLFHQPTFEFNQFNTNRPSAFLISKIMQPKPDYSCIDFQKSSPAYLVVTTIHCNQYCSYWQYL